MTFRVAKEFRALRLPWAAGMVAAIAATVAGRATGDPGALNYCLMVSAGCVVVLAAMSIGAEFRHRTFSLLLSQPCPRREIWRDKLRVVGALAGTVFLAELVCGVAGSWTMVFVSDPRGTGLLGMNLEVLSVPFLLLAMVCSAPFWTLAARSIIGGAVFSLTGAMAVGLLSWWVLGLVFPVDLMAPPQRAAVLAWPLLVLLYSAVSLYAGWRRFERFELKDAILGESTILSGRAAPRARRWHWLRIRPRGALRNLVRKELRLQRPTLVVAMAFCVCWLLAVALKPARVEGLEEILYPGLAFAYVVVALALAGTISQGEERALGLGAWHLTLPISARRQWWVKLGVAALVAVVLGLVLPGVLAVATLPDARAGLGSVLHALEVLQLGDLLVKGLPVGAGLWLFFVLSFWAATLLGDTLRAIFMAVLGCIALLLCAALSGWLFEHAGGLETEALREISAAWQLPLYYADEVGPWSFAASTVVISLAALVQSRYLFRRAQVPRVAILTCVAVLLAIAGLAGAWWADFSVSLGRDPGGPLRMEVLQAVRALPDLEKRLLESGRWMHLTESDLEKVFPLSGRTKRWLRGAGLTLRLQSFSFTTGHQPPRTTRVVTVVIVFPKGYEIAIPEPAIVDEVGPGNVGRQR